jgi:hypothetical protein
MDYQVALAPDLQISPEEFVIAWNQSSARPEGTQARLEPAGAKGFNLLLETVLIGVTTELTTHALITYITSLLSKHRPRRRITVVEAEQPDGTRLLVATLEED